MAKTKVKNVDLTVETEKSKVKVKKTGKKVDLVIDTPNVDVTFKKDENSKELNFDGKNVDVHVKQEGENVQADIKSSSKLGKFLGKLILNRFKRK
jgi:hypothetical protein